MPPLRPSKHPKHCLVGQEALAALVVGVRHQAQAVTVSYGPNGGLVWLDRQSGMVPIKDGDAIAREWLPHDKWQALGAKALTKTLINLAKDKGDGTKACALMASAMLTKAWRFIVAGHDPATLALQGDKTLLEAIEALYAQSRPLKDQQDLCDALLVAVGNQQIAEVVAEATMSVGTDGFISVRDGQRTEGLTLEFRDGLVFESGFLAHGIQPPNKELWTLDGPMVAIVPGRLHSFSQVQSIMEEASAFAPRPLLLIVEGIEKEAMATIVLNQRQDVLCCVPFNVPGTPLTKLDKMRDLAVLSGATIFDASAGMSLDSFDPTWFGYLRTVEQTVTQTTLVAYDDRRDAIQSEAASLRQQAAVTISGHDRDRWNARAAALNGGLCLIHVGGSSAPERAVLRGLTEKALRVADAVLRHGLVAGGGKALASVGNSLASDSLGTTILKAGLVAPFERLKPDPDSTNEDATDVVVTGLRAAWSLCAVLLRTGALIVPAKEI